MQPFPNRKPETPFPQFPFLSKREPKTIEMQIPEGDFRSRAPRMARVRPRKFAQKFRITYGGSRSWRPSEARASPDNTNCVAFTDL